MNMGPTPYKKENANQKLYSHACYFLYCICMYNVEVGGHIQQDIFLIWTNMFFMLVVAVMKNSTQGLFVAKISIKTRQ